MVFDSTHGRWSNLLCHIKVIFSNVPIDVNFYHFLLMIPSFFGKVGTTEQFTIIFKIHSIFNENYVPFFKQVQKFVINFCVFSFYFLETLLKFFTHLVVCSTQRNQQSSLKALLQSVVTLATACSSNIIGMKHLLTAQSYLDYLTYHFFICGKRD